MGILGDRFSGWVEERTLAWRDRLRGWMASWLMKGVEAFLEDIEPESIEQTRTIVDRLRANPATPPEIRALLDRFQAGGFSPLIILGIIMFIPMIIQAVTTMWQPGTKQMSYQEERAAKTFRFDPMAIITAWRRDKPTYEYLFDDLKDLGWSDDRIEALKFLTLFYPAPADLVRWQAREVFEPAMIAKYGLDDELGGIEREPFYKAGMTDEQITNYWRAHWEHASWMQVVEMLHRGLLTEAEVYDWFRLVEIPPFWRALLIKSAYTWPTRVDVRRWWDMRTIDETELRRLYSGMGYRGVNLDNYVKWTKVYTDFPMMMTRFSNGWITEEDIRAWLRGLDIPEDRIEQFIQEKTKPEAPARVAKERDLTAAEIMKGIKKGVIEEYEGAELLQDMGYSADEAWYKIEIDKAVAAGSPETFEEFKSLTQRYKIAIGKEAKPMTEELKKAADEVVRVTNEIASLNESIKQEKAGLIETEVLPEETTKRLKKLQVARNRAIAELERVKSEYDRLLAEWRHGG